MAYGDSRILATHVGSLVRPPTLVEFIKKIESGQPYDELAHERCLELEIEKVVSEQINVGIDIVSDGEFGKAKNWSFYIHDRLSGVTRRPLSPEEEDDPLAVIGGGHDRRAFPEFYAEYDNADGFAKRYAFRTVCDGPIEYVGHEALQRDIKNLKEAVKGKDVVDAFLPVVGPASALPGVKNEHYEDQESLLHALAGALREEYKAITDAGLIAQIDDAFIPYMYEKMVPPMSMEEYRKWANQCIEALNFALEGIPRERTRYHLCWGSWHGPHVHDVPLREIVDLILKIDVGGILFENANPRHEHEWRVWETVKLGKDTVLIPGVISHATNVVEHPELVSQRLVRLAKIVGRENVMGGTDCGFAQSPFTARVHPSIMWAKLEALSEGCEIATRELWG